MRDPKCELSAYKRVATDSVKTVVIAARSSPVSAFPIKRRIQHQADFTRA